MNEEGTGKAKVIYFRRPKPSPVAFLVYVEGHGESYCHPCKDLDQALDYIEERELDKGVVCSLYQNVPLEDNQEDYSLDSH